MSRAVMLSIRPKWCVEIANGRKTIEVRKTRPKIEPPFKCYIYCTKNGEAIWGKNYERNGYLNGKVIGEFVCDAILPIWFKCSCDPAVMTTHYEIPGTRLTDVEIMEYLGNGVEGYGWHISDLEIYDTPKTLQEFGITMPPQSWRYVEEET